MPPSVEDKQDVLRQHHADLASIKQAQTDINRRLGSLETKQDAFLAKVTDQVLLEKRVEDLEAGEIEEGQGKKEWITWIIQVLVGSILVALGSQVGLEVLTP